MMVSISPALTSNAKKWLLETAYFFRVGKKVLADVWALDTAQKPYAWQRLNPEGDKPSARM